ncbi:MAG: oligosaccharide flippase family protein [Myxococcota bacterium]
MSEAPPESSGVPGDEPSSEDEAAEKKFMSGSRWALIGYGGEQLMRFVGNLILWRLLYEEAFGIMALVNVVLQALEMFSDVGINASIIQSKRGGEPTFVNTAWTVQVLRGVLIFLIACGLAYPAAWFYDEPQLAIFIPIVGSTSILYGLRSTKYWTEQKAVRLKAITLIDLAMQLIASITMIVWALIHPSVWALVSGSVVGGVLGLILSHAVLPGVRNRLCWDRAVAKELITFGAWIFLSTIFTFVALQSDRLVFGKLVSLKMLGVYSIAQIYATLPPLLIGHLLKSVLFPVLSEEKNAGRPLGPAYRRVRVKVMVASSWMIACLIAGAPALIDFLYDERAKEAAWIIQILAMGGWFLVLEIINNTPILSLGYPRWLAISNLAKILAMAIAIPVGFSLFGFPGAVGGFAAAELAKYITTLVACEKYDLRAWPQDIAFTLGLASSSAAGLLVSHYARSAEIHPFLEGFAIFLLLSGIWGATYRILQRRLS